MGEENKNETMSLYDRVRAGLEASAENAPEQGEAPAESEAPVDNAPVEETAPAQTEPAQSEQAVNPNIPDLTGQAQAPAQAAPQTVQPGNNPGMMQYLIQRLQAAEAQNQQLMAQAQQAQATVQEQSQAAQGAVDMATSQPTITVPVLDFNEMQYDDDSTRAEKMNAWQDAMVRKITDEVAKQYSGQLAPIREEYEAKKEAAEREAARQAIWGDSRFADFKDRDEQIQKILNANPELAQFGAQRSYLMGGMIARGLDYNPNPTPEQIVQYVQNSPEAQRMLDQQRAQAVADRNQQIPTVMPSSGLATANAIPESTPASMDDVRDRMAKRFGR